MASLQGLANAGKTAPHTGPQSSTARQHTSRTHGTAAQHASHGPSSRMTKPTANGTTAAQGPSASPFLGQRLRARALPSRGAAATTVPNATPARTGGPSHLPGSRQLGCLVGHPSGPSWAPSRRAALSRPPLSSPLSPSKTGPSPPTSPWFPSGPSPRRPQVAPRVSPGEIMGPLASTNMLEVVHNLGLDSLTFLAATVLVVPTCTSLRISPVLGFLMAGLALDQLGLFRNVNEIQELSELGILFLLFEMGLELTLERLKKLASFAFGMGTLQVLLCTAAFSVFALPPGEAFGTYFLERVVNSPPDLVNIRTIDEAIVIGTALSLSSSAFVLQLISESGELATTFGSATLGILLLQDIAVVPLLVALPLIENPNVGGPGTDWFVLCLGAAKALGGLTVTVFGGRFLLRRIFTVVAESRSPETFLALTLLTVTGMAFLTQLLGFSDSLGAFLAGALLAETNYRTQIEADIQPFRGLLLGLFFVTTGTSIDVGLLSQQWPTVIVLLLGLISVKTAIITSLGPRFGLTLPESIRTGLLLSQGGEFAFVVFSLANSLNVLPEELNQLLIIVVVLSMAMTPLLNEAGKRAAEYITLRTMGSSITSRLDEVDKSLGVAEQTIVIVGFSEGGQLVANLISSPLAVGNARGVTPYIAFDLSPTLVKNARKKGIPVYYGDGSRVEVLKTAGIEQVRAFVVTYTGLKKSVEAVEALHHAFPQTPIFAMGNTPAHCKELMEAGATQVASQKLESSLQLGSAILQMGGTSADTIQLLTKELRLFVQREVLGDATVGPVIAPDTGVLTSPVSFTAVLSIACVL
eukprot:jgi/Mesvir1/5960/Mv00716-RA.2